MPDGLPVPIGLIPTFVIVGPLALLALLVPAVFGGLAMLLRRWLVLLSVGGLACTLYLARQWLHGMLNSFGMGSPRLLWAALAVIAAAAMVWSWRRQRSLPPVEGSVRAGRIARAILLAVALATTALLLYNSNGWDLARSPTPELLVITTVAWIGTADALRLMLLPRRGPGSAAPSSEPIMLGGLAAVCAVLGVAAVTAPETPASPVRVIWSFEPFARGAIISSPVVDQDHVFTAVIQDFGGTSAGAVYCLRRDNRQVLWKFDEAGTLQHMYSTPCLSGGRLYVGEGMHANLQSRLFCLDAASGRKLWEFQTSSHVESSPCTAGDCVYFGAGDDGIYCLDAATGQKRWQFASAVHVDSNPVIDHDRLFAGAGVSRLYREPSTFCLDARTGAPLWRVRTDLPAWGSPTVVDDAVFFGLGNGRLLRGPERPENPAGAVLCLDAATGRTRWRHDLGDAVFAKAAHDSHTIYVGTRDGSCYALERATGQERWRVPLGSPVLTRAVLSRRSLYVVASAGRICRLDADNGHVVWDFDVAAHAHSSARLLASPAVADAGGHRRLYIGTELQSAVSSAAVLFCLEDEIPDVPRE